MRTYAPAPPRKRVAAVCRYILDKELSFAVELDFFNASAEIKGLEAGALSDEAELAKQLREKYMLNPSEEYTAEEISHMNDDDIIYRLFFEQIKFLYSLQRINAPQFSLYILN